MTRRAENLYFSPAAYRRRFEALAARSFAVPVKAIHALATRCTVAACFSQGGGALGLRDRAEELRHVAHRREAGATS